MPPKKKTTRRELKSATVSRTRKPEDMSLEEWQIVLRREFGRKQDFSYKNLGSEKFFSEFAVTNPKTLRTYRVAIRGTTPGANFCSCPDFSVNTLGTCKHIEWLLSRLEKQPGAKKAFMEGAHPAYSEVFVQYGVRRQARFNPGTDCPTAFRRVASRYFDAHGLLRLGAVMTFETFTREAAAAGHEVRIYNDALEYIARLRDDENRRGAVEKLFEGNKADAAFARLLKTTLYPYQRKGALFAAKAGRCLIADDMGLGKTIQSIAAVEILAKTAGVERVLVVCPTALKQQWKQEVERFSTRDALIVEGFSQERKTRYQENSFYKMINYETVHRDIDLINAWSPDVVILDEAQRIKNWATRRAQYVKRIESPYTIVLTGTPLENRLEELHSIMEFVDRFRLGPLFRFLCEHQHLGDDGRVVGYKSLDKIKESLSTVLTRRKKSDVLLELPERSDKRMFVDMTETQRKIHDSNKDIVAEIVGKWRRRGFLTEQEQRRLMVAMQYMRMSCNSVYLIDKATDDGPKIDECASLLAEILENKDDKVVVFSQWLGTHELILRRMEDKEKAFAFYNGSLNSKQRRETIDRFKTDPECRVLLCTDSGGVGLNLQVASVLINMDQPWNPAVLEQRVARIHRLGQRRNVRIYHFIARDSIEHGMLDVIQFKSAMFAGVLDGGEGEIFLGGGKMKKFMETVEAVSGSIPAERRPSDAMVAEQEETIEAIIPEQEDEQKPADVWNELMKTGLEMMQSIGKNVSGQQDDGKFSVDPSSLFARNEKTGTRELRIPLSDETAQRLGSFLSGLGEIVKSFGNR
jgi:superfamily II DNA or RNA helicase